MIEHVYSVASHMQQRCYFSFAFQEFQKRLLDGCVITQKVDYYRKHSDSHKRCAQQFSPTAKFSKAMIDHVITGSTLWQTDLQIDRKCKDLLTLAT